MPNVEAIREWVAALRGGEFTQTTGALHDAMGYCCLGVACETFRRITGKGRWDSLYDFDMGDYTVGDVLPEVVAGWLGVDTNPALVSAADPVLAELVLAASLNDEHGYTFADIADAIERTYLRETTDA